MKKNKGQTVDLLYKNKEGQKKKNNKSSKSKNKKKQTNKTNKNQQSNNLNNEIVIELQPKSSGKGTKAKTKKAKNKIKNNAQEKKAKKKQANKKSKNKSKIKAKLIKWTVIMLLLLVVIILFMLSSVFNIKEIVVVNNKQISSQEIINLSQLSVGVNMFKTTKNTIKNNIKNNAYIEDVQVKRNINGTITIDITEREAQYVIATEGINIYISNQGYILEKTETDLELPKISGIVTASQDLTVGNRLCVDDLNKLNDVIKIMNAIEYTTLNGLITQIDITDSSNYVLTLASENKTVEFGDVTNINVKIGMIETILVEEKGKAGKIYFQFDTNNKAVFREEV